MPSALNVTVPFIGPLTSSNVLLSGSLPRMSFVLTSPATGVPSSVVAESFTASGWMSASETVIVTVACEVSPSVSVIR